MCSNLVPVHALLSFGSNYFYPCNQATSTNPDQPAHPHIYYLDNTYFEISVLMMKGFVQIKIWITPVQNFRLVKVEDAEKRYIFFKK
jgi:hypothetical protein